MVNQISWNRDGYEPFLDFLKGLCIVWVVLTHCMTTEMQHACLFPLWGSYAVPVFLTISCFHYLKRPHAFNRSYLSKVWKRIMLPFICVQLLLVGKILIVYYMGSGVLTTPLKSVIMHGGAGPGTYFFWVHLQFVLFILPITAYLLRTKPVSNTVLLLILVVASVVLELMSNWLQVPLYIHRLTFFPYLFLVYYGYRLASDSIVLSWESYIFAVLSFVFVVVLNYTTIDFTPWVYMQTASNFHVYCFPFMMYGVICVANILYKKTGGVFESVPKRIGKHSYQIFLVQMIVFELIPTAMNKWLYVLITTTMSIIPVFIYYYVKDKILKQ